MIARLDNRTAAVLAAIALLALLFAAQAGVAATSPAVGGADAAQAVGKAGFAYLGGLRTFAAAVLWNRLEPIFHDYYEGTTLGEQTYVLPSIYLIEALDPQFIQGYYLASYALAMRGDFPEALALAKEGIANNPKSGFLRANYVQMLLMQDPKRNLPEMRRQAEAGLAEDAEWQSPEDLFEGLAIFRSVYRMTGDTATEQRIQAVMDDIESNVDVGDHDHDGDGAQDH